ncbi:hypothetical protein UPYG_G00152230 [Umbra pygmaea]|uniref:Uncharacterized protein n=1 Tax=Umbra pygmaea TaxID=75934 RepID=A0ABD0WXP0_UMBPY
MRFGKAIKKAIVLTRQTPENSRIGQLCSVFMPRTMTMNSHPTQTTAPLDLCTRTRERGSGADKTPAGKGRSRDSAELRVQNSANQKHFISPKENPSTVVDTLDHACGSSLIKPPVDTGSPEVLEKTHSSAATSPTLFTPTSPKGTIDRHTLDRSSLPLRKRRFDSERDILGQSLRPTTQGREARLSPNKNTELFSKHSPPKAVKTDYNEYTDVLVSVPQREELSASSNYDKGQHPIDPVRSIPPHHRPTYFSYPVIQWPSMPSLVLGMPVSHLPPSRHPLEQTEHLQADVTLATRQDDDGDTALHIAVVQGQEDLVHRMIHLLGLAKKEVDIFNNLRQTPLHLAVITHQPQLVKALLCAGADPGSLDRNGQTAVHLCCEHGQQACLSVVLSHTSSSSCLELRNYEGLTPLHLAVQGEHKELARMLLTAGADINAMDIKSGRSPLIHAVEINSFDLVHFLIENDCNVNGQSYSGNTALHSACGRGKVELVRLLMKNRADSSVKNYHNDTPAMVAKNKKVTDVLRGRGSRTQQPKALEQECVPVSPHGNTTNSNNVNGSISPNNSLCNSPSPTPQPLHRRTSHSPRVPHSPHSQSAESLSDRQSPMETQENEELLVRLGASGVSTADMSWPQRRPYPLSYSYMPAVQPLPQAYPSLSALHPSSPVYHSPVLQRHYYPEPPIILLHPNVSHPATIYPVAQITPCQSRPSSRCSDQSDVSTMSVSSSGGKGES